MLPAGIAVMVVSTVVGVMALALWALTSATSRSAVKRTLDAMYLTDPYEDASYFDPAAGYHQSVSPELPAEHHAPVDEVEEVDEMEQGQSPRWVLVLTAFQGGGLVLGMLMVMIGSIP